MIGINIDKAKEVSHKIRRELRDIEFAPYDKIISAQIPNKTQEAESFREAIRAKYADVQTQIDLAKEPSELLLILKQAQNV